MNVQRLVYMLLPLLLMGMYAQLFFVQEKQKSIKEVRLLPSMPTEVFQILGHSYMEQLIADMLFIKVAVFYGGGHKISDSVDEMANHFVTMNKLNPKMIDFYYRTEAALADKGDEYVRTTNQILKVGREALPNQVTIPYFEGFNYFYYLDEPIKAAELLRLASTYDVKYKWLGHLASTLEARGGNIRAGLVWLKGMHASMDEGDEKERYAKDIQDYEKGMEVNMALARFVEKHGQYPESLTDLIPSELNALPKLSAKFTFDYEPPKLSLKVR
ncbi:MAG: hypothetical protein R8M46_07180 [Ghiorsea sp.]